MECIKPLSKNKHKKEHVIFEFVMEIIENFIIKLNYVDYL